MTKAKIITLKIRAVQHKCVYNSYAESHIASKFNAKQMTKSVDD